MGLLPEVTGLLLEVTGLLPEVTGLLPEVTDSHQKSHIFFEFQVL